MDAAHFQVFITCLVVIQQNSVTDDAHCQRSNAGLDDGHALSSLNHSLITN